MAFGRSLLFRHPSFWAEEEAEQLPNQLIEDPRVFGAERHIYNALAAQVTPFIAALDELTLNVGPLVGSATLSRDVFKRCISSLPEITTGALRGDPAT